MFRYRKFRLSWYGLPGNKVGPVLPSYFVKSPFDYFHPMTRREANWRMFKYFDDLRNEFMFYDVHDLRLFLPGCPGVHFELSENNNNPMNVDN